MVRPKAMIRLKARLQPKVKMRPKAMIRLASEVQSKMIFMGHQILSCHVPVVRSFFIL
jgi:hypothetical protein